MTFNIGTAVRSMRDGVKVRRRGWNGKGMHIALAIDGVACAEVGSYDLVPFVFMRTAQGTFVPWLCSQADLLAEDWEVAT